MLLLMIAAAIVSGVSIATGFAARARIAARRQRPAAGAPPALLALPGWAAAAARLLRRDRTVAALAIWLIVVDTTLALAAPWPLQIVVDYGLARRPLPHWLAGLKTVPPTGLAVAAALSGLLLLGLSSLAGYLVTFLVSYVGQRMGSMLRVGLLDHLLAATPRAVAQFPLGELTSRLGPDSDRVSDTVAAVIETLIPDLALLAGMTAITAILDWRLTLVALGVIPLYVIAARLRNRSLRPAQQQARTRAGELSALSASLLARIPAVHVFGRADSEVAGYHRASTAAANAVVTAIDASARFSPLTDALPGLGLAAALVAGTTEVSAGRLTTGGLLVFLAYLSSLTSPVRSLAQLSATLTRGTVSKERINELLRLPQMSPRPRSARHGGHPSLPPAPRRRGAAIDITDVSYAHQPGHQVLKSASLRITAGELICITGPSGTGKSTLLSLLVRLADPESGTITINGSDLTRLHLPQLRQMITLVPQDPWLHSGTIADNIGYGNQAASPAQIRTAAETAGVITFADTLPSRLNTPVGEHGRNLSGGQQRRVAVARALAADTPVLLLDEPTTGLDPAAEEQLINSLLTATAGKTVIIVTHSQRLTALADRVLRLDHGELRSTPPTPQPARAATPAHADLQPVPP